MLASALGTAVLVVLGAALGVLAAFTWYRSRLGRPAPGADTLGATIADVHEGGAIRLGAFGDDGEDVELVVSERTRVRQGALEWREMRGSYRGRTMALEWRERPDGLGVVAFKKTGLPLSELALDPASLEQARPGGPPVAALGGVFKVEDVGDAIREGKDPKGSIAFKTWVLFDEEKRRSIRIERVGEQPATASLGLPVAGDAIEIVRRRG